MNEWTSIHFTKDIEKRWEDMNEEQNVPEHGSRSFT